MIGNFNNQGSQTTNQSLEPVIIKTDLGSKDGQNKCPQCGATDIAINENTGKLRCNFCRHEFEPKKVEGLVNDLENLKGQIIGSGATDILKDTNDIMTFKCSSCGAEVVINTASSTQARCHWCRNTLSVNQQISNGSIPDVVLPFKMKKEEAKIQIEKFVEKRKFFAHPKFKSEFTTENIMGVYFPYMLIDINSHAHFTGNGEIQTRKYKNGNNETTYYDADLYEVERDFDLVIKGITVESNSERVNKSDLNQTNNVINAIMPFDIENCSKYDANFLNGYTSEKRDININQLKPIVEIQAKDIARYACNDTLKKYDRGVVWKSEQLDRIGEQWKSAYLPVWLYSYQQIKGSRKILHYVAVNARTKETMGSIPIHLPKLLIISVIVEFFGIIAMNYLDFDYNWLFLLSGFFYFLFIYIKYRNSNARHTYEKETKTSMTNLKSVDKFLKKQTNLTHSQITGANNKKVNGQNLGTSLLNSVIEQNPLFKISEKEKGSEEK